MCYNVNVIQSTNKNNILKKIVEYKEVNMRGKRFPNFSSVEPQTTHEKPIQIPSPLPPAPLPHTFPIWTINYYEPYMHIQHSDDPEVYLLIVRLGLHPCTNQLLSLPSNFPVFFRDPRHYCILFFIYAPRTIQNKKNCSF